MVVHSGMIHGRFQPFHKGHLDYLKAGLSRCRRLIVGITNPEPRTIVEVASNGHRHRAAANPYTFYLRVRMIQESVLRCPECADRFADVTIVPFPIHTPEVWEHYIAGQDVVQFMRLLDPWDYDKQTTFERHGFRVEIDNATRLYSGTEVRADLIGGGSTWRSKVPDGTRHVLEAWLSGAPF